ncbi:hypothetical protein CVIRNUC_009843 [Coccomyxa viridis]|uniref:BZIP domain-containing protein n=1 Tax=Coccomyxa viridis TaxID=1274662 RepID=A0AAV1IH33_9CHLO|nr:hypothetical protein CVIRNUC_009843 [Coccomyxa viridis]
MQASQPSQADQGGGGRGAAGHEGTSSKETVSAEAGPAAMQVDERAALKEPEMAVQEESSALSVRSRRRKPYKRPRPEEEGARQPSGSAAALRRVDTPVVTRRQAGQRAADQSGGEAAEASGVPERAGDGAGGQTPVRAKIEIEQDGATRQTPDLATPSLAAPAAAWGAAHLSTPSAEEASRADGQHGGLPMQMSMAAPEIQQQSSRASEKLQRLLGSLSSTLAQRGAALPGPAAAASAPAGAGRGDQVRGSLAAMPPASQQAFLRALLKSISKDRRPDSAAAQAEAAPKCKSLPDTIQRPKAIRISPAQSARPFGMGDAGPAPALDSLASLARYLAQQREGAGSAEAHAPAGAAAAMLPVSQVLAQQALAVSSGQPAAQEQSPALWSVLQGGHLGGQPGGQLGQPLHAPLAFAEPSQPLERRFRSLSNPSPSSLMFGKATSLLPNPFAQFSSIPLQGKLGDPAGLLNRPVRRRTPLPDLMEGGGDSDTVSVLSGHQSRPEGEVTGPQAPSQLSMDSEAAKIRKALAGALDFSGSNKPGLPKELQSFSQEFAPRSSLVQQELARVARSALLSGVPSGQALGSGAALGTGKPSLGSVGRLQSLPVRASDMSAASFQVLETLLSQAHKEGGGSMSSELERYFVQGSAPAAATLMAPAAPRMQRPEVQATQTSLANLLLRQPLQLPAQAPLPAPMQGLGPTQSLSAEAAEDDQLGETPLDKAERRRLNNKISARRTRERRNFQLRKLEEENDVLGKQILTLQQQVTELRSANHVLLQNLPQISDHQRKLMDENENLKLEVQGLRSLMLQGMQLPGSSAIPAPALQGSALTAAMTLALSRPPL